MEEFVISIMNQFGYFGIFFLIFIENIFPPIPSEVGLLFDSFMSTYSKLNLFGMIIFSTLGSTVGAIVLYYIGKILNKERLKKIVSGKIGKVLRLKASDIEKADKWFDTKGNKTVFFCRFIPVVRSLISIPAGFASMNIPKFLLLTTIGSAVWNTVLVYIGSMLGEAWEKAMPYFDKYSSIAAVVIFVAVCLAAVYFLVIKKKKKNS